MGRRATVCMLMNVMMAATCAAAQTGRAVPRPPAQAPGPPRPEDGSAAPDGYAPIPQWLGQTRAAKPAHSAAFDVQTVVEGLNGAFCFDFLPDSRIIVGERAASGCSGKTLEEGSARRGLGRRRCGCRGGSHESGARR